MGKVLHIGLDVGSTTVKIAILDERDNLVFSHYQRHFSDVQHTVSNLLQKMYLHLKNSEVTMNVTAPAALPHRNKLACPSFRKLSLAVKLFSVLYLRPTWRSSWEEKMPRSPISEILRNSG